MAYNLGETIFVVDRSRCSYDIIRTIVSEVEQHGIQNLAGLIDYGTFRNYDDAAHYAQNEMEKLLCTSVGRAIEHKLRERLGRLWTSEHREHVMKSPLKAKSPITFYPPQTLKEEPKVPTSYITPGTVVFVPITPLTHHLFAPHAYKPSGRLYFVLGSVVKSVKLDRKWDGSVYYDIDSEYKSQSLYISEVEAKHALVRVFKEQTGGYLEFVKVLVVSQEDELRAKTKATQQTYENNTSRLIGA